MQNQGSLVDPPTDSRILIVARISCGWMGRICVYECVCVCVCVFVVGRVGEGEDADSGFCLYLSQFRFLHAPHRWRRMHAR